MPNAASKVVVIDDHPIFRECLRTFLGNESDIEVVAEGSDGRDLEKLVGYHRPDLVIVDLSMPGVDGLTTLDRLQALQSKTPTLVVSAVDDLRSIRAAFHRGARGFVPKRSMPAEILKGVRRVLAGETYWSEQLGDATPIVHQETVGTSELTDRERSVLQASSQGYSLKEIADVMKVSVKTVETYKARGFKKLQLRSRVELMRYAVRAGWLC